MKRKLLRIAAVVAVVLVVLVGGLVGYVEASADASLRFPDAPSPAIHASSDPAVIERGRLLVHGAAHCAACHGTYDEDHPEALHEDVPLSGGAVITPPFGVFRAANITPDRETGIGAWSDEEIARVIRTGVRRSGEISVFMKLAVGPQSDEDLTAIVSYLRSVPAVRHEVAPSEPNFVARALVTFSPIPPDPIEGMPHVPEGPEPSIERGRYLSTGPALCEDCHTPASSEDMFAPDRGRRFAGGEPMEGHGQGRDLEFAPPNLTSDPRTGVTGRMSEDAWVDRFRRIGRTASGSPMPWENFGRLSDSDLRSIYRYARSVPPVRRDTGPTSRQPGSFTIEGE